MSTPDLTPDQIIELEQLAAEETKLAADAAAITERRDTIKAILRDRLPIGTHDLGGYKVLVKKPAQLTDWKALEAAYPFVEHPAMYSATLDTAKAKSQLAPVVIAGFAKVPGTPSVVVS